MLPSLTWTRSGVEKVCLLSLNNSDLENMTKTLRGGTVKANRRKRQLGEQSRSDITSATRRIEPLWKPAYNRELCCYMVIRLFFAPQHSMSGQTTCKVRRPVLGETTSLMAGVLYQTSKRFTLGKAFLNSITYYSIWIHNGF